MCGSCSAKPSSTQVLAILLATVVALPGFGQTALVQGGESQAEAEVLFRFPLGGVVTAGPVIGAGRAWLLSDSKTLYVLTVDGVAIGKRVLPERRAAFIACDSFGRAAISTGGTGISLVNRAGQEVWRVDLGAVPRYAPVFASDGRIFVEAGGTLHALAPNGRRLWTSALPSGASAPLVIGPGGGPVVGLSCGILSLYLPDGGGPASLELGSAPVAIAASPERVAAALADGRFVVVEPVEGTLALAPASGNATAQAARLGSQPVAAAWSPDGFYALGADRTLLALDEAGRERWRTAADIGGGRATLAAFVGRVVAGSSAKVSSYGSDGSIFRTLGLRNSVSMPALTPDGTVLAGGADWILYAYRFERVLVSGDQASIADLDFAAIDEVAREESYWSTASFDDSAVIERLRHIEKSIESGTIGTGSRRESLYLAAVALGRMDAPFGSGAIAPGPTPRGPLSRIQACDILGALGLPQAVPVLVEVFRRDPEPAVRAAAAQAVAAIGLDTDGSALAAFAGAAGGRLDERTASAVVDAIEGLYRASGALDDRSGVLALFRISAGDYPRDLRTKAEKALMRISSAK